MGTLLPRASRCLGALLKLSKPPSSLTPTMPGSLDAHTKRGHVVTFSLLILFSLIEWAIAAYLVNTYNSNDNYPSNSVRDRVRFLPWVFWLAGTAALAAALGGSLDCDTYGRPHCDTLNALEAFGWINWVIVTIMFAYALFAGARSARSGNGFGGAMVDV